MGTYSDQGKIWRKRERKLTGFSGTKYSRIDLVKLAEDSL